MRAVEVGGPHLWAALHRARVDGQPKTLAQVEDALFQHYLPMARSMAVQHAPDTPEAAIHAAELGLAQAILDWRQLDAAGFDRFAQHAISTQLRRSTTPAGQHDRVPPAPPHRGGEPHA